MEERTPYRTASDALLQTCDKPAMIEPGHRPLSTRNLDELERELMEVERRLLPLLNGIRAVLGKKPVYAPKG